MKTSCKAGLILLALAAASNAAVSLPSVISDHMVLQAGTPAAIWGWAAPGESVAISIAGQTQKTVADKDGKWSVRLEKLAASSEPQTLTVQGENKLTVHDVLVGEVWLASGQSNMEMQIKGKMHGAVDHADEEIAAADHPTIRMFFHRETYSIYDAAVPSSELEKDRAGEWHVCSPQTLADFSALGYFFASDLQKEVKAPIGIINSSVGGTPIEAWTSLEAQRAEPAVQPVLDDWKKTLTDYDAAQAQKTYLEAKERWLKERAAATKLGQPAPKAPTPFKNSGVMAPGVLFNSRIAPLIPYSVRGVIWYQGERNALGPLSGLYGVQLRTLVRDWRKRWSNDDLYFAWVQLANIQKLQSVPSEPKGWGVNVREGQRRALDVPHTGMAITIDLGGEKAGHPTNKADFAARLSRVVLHDVYGRPDPLWTGPLLHDAKAENGKMTLTFDHATGLKATMGELEGFAIAGEDRKFVWGSVRIEGEKVIVWSDAIAKPMAVRYSWAANPKGNLVNAAGLPASPFRTDDWEEPAKPVAPAKNAVAAPATLTPVVAAPANYAAQLSASVQPMRQIAYKTIGDRALHLDFFTPQGWKAEDRRPCFIGIHGGGWTSGAPRSMYSFVQHCVGEGMVGISVEYRLYKAGTDVSVFECVKDARSGVRYVRAHAAELGIDPQKIIVSGASAGGHLAAATAMFEVDEAGEDTAVSCAPNALVLLSPVIDTSKEGYGNAKVGERWQELSPAHRVRQGMPPVIHFHGTGDATTPYLGAQRFHEAMQQAGNRCELVTVDGAQHTYMFKDAARHAETLRRMDDFLASLGFIAAAPKP
ncbi:MAG: alpha/beta hydrolase fold domain-containing protein [Chthoniobacter sp.]